MYIQTVLLLLGLVSFTQVALAEGLERLFTTAEERLELNIARIERQNVGTDGEKLSTGPPQHITFNGLVSRSDGAVTVWVNGSEELLRPGFSIKPEERKDIAVPIVLSKARQEILLKPGETLNALDGKIFENYDANFSNPKSETEKLAAKTVATTPSVNQGLDNLTSSSARPLLETKQCKTGRKLCGQRCISEKQECGGKKLVSKIVATKSVLGKKRNKQNKSTSSTARSSSETKQCKTGKSCEKSCTGTANEKECRGKKLASKNSAAKTQTVSQLLEKVFPKIKFRGKRK
jgi:hypothetical protein